MKKVDKSFITSGNINSVIFTIAIPLMLNNIVRTLYNLTDGLFVAQLSAEDFAATAFVWPLNSFFISIGIGIGIGATALISQNLGANRIKKASNYASNAILMIFSIGFFASVLGYLLAPILVRLMGAEGIFLDKSITYLKINFVGLIFDFGFFGYQAILNAQGSTRSITMMSIISSLVNVILDPIFIFHRIPLINLPGLDLGIAGAAWATVISKIVLLMLAFVEINRNSDVRVNYSLSIFEFDAVKNILKIGMPSALGVGGSSLGFSVMNSFIQSYGTNTLAAFSIGNRITDLVMQPQMGIGTGLTSIIGQNVGAQNFKRIRDIFNRTILIILGFSTISSVLIILFDNSLLNLFIKEGSDPVLWDLASEYLVYSAFIIFFMGLFSALNGFFQGVGKTKYSMYMSIGRLWLLRIPMIWAFSTFSGIGPSGIWISMLLSNMFTVLWGLFVYKKLDIEYILN